MSRLLGPQELEAAIRQVGAERYHDKHPFHRLLHGGKLNKGQVQAWALNRYCYQSGVPRKDAAAWLVRKSREGYELDLKLWAGLWMIEHNPDGSRVV